MELKRFKQLLESTMGDVKPLIMEQSATTTTTTVQQSGEIKTVKKPLQWETTTHLLQKPYLALQTKQNGSFGKCKITGSEKLRTGPDGWQFFSGCNIPNFGVTAGDKTGLLIYDPTNSTLYIGGNFDTSTNKFTGGSVTAKSFKFFSPLEQSIWRDYKG